MEKVPIQETVEKLITTNSVYSSNPEEKGYYCPICHKFVPRKRIEILGKVKYVQPRCTCEVKEYDEKRKQIAERKKKMDIEAKFSISSLGKRFDECRFENFKQRSGTERSFRLALAYAKKFNKEVEEGIIFWGNPGNGKTHLAASIAHAVKNKGYTVVFQTTVELLGRIKSTFGKGSRETEQGIMSALVDCDLLVLDDLGAEKSTDWVSEKMFEIIEKRYRAKRPTIFTTNFSQNQLIERLGGEIQGARIVDRLSEANILIKNKAASYRAELAQARVKKMIGG